MRYIGEILKWAREHTDNQDYSVDSNGDTVSGIPDGLLLEYANDAQDRLQSIIISTYPRVFVEEEIISLSADTEGYTISDNVFLNNRLISVEYSHTGNLKDYITLDQKGMRRRVTDTSNHPSFYIRRDGQILLDPIYSGTNGSIRVNYYRELDNLDIRRGEVTSTTGTPITAITLEENATPTHTYLDPQPSSAPLKLAEYVCVCDKDGVSQAYNVPVSGYNSTTRVLTVPSHTLGTGEAISAGDYITLGRYSTTHSDLAENAERYIKIYIQKRLFVKDSSQDVAAEDPELGGIEADIINAYSDISEDIDFVPILDPYML